MITGTAEPIENAYALALLDLDGVVYRGKNPVAHAAQSIREAQSQGMSVEYTTNNSARMQATVAEQLRGFGLDVEPSQVITSSVVAARMLARQVPAGSKIMVVGAEHLKAEVRSQGLEIVESSEDDPAAVIQGWYPEISWHDLAEASFAVEHGAQYFVTNLDSTLPKEHGVAPGCGSLIQAVVTATGVKPISSAGKPESAMYDEARVLAAGEGEDMVAKSRCLAIGDRLDTDIEAGNRGGYDSLLVLTGVCTPEQLLRAPEYLRPTFVAKDLRGLHETMPEPQRLDDGVWRCTDDEAYVVGERLEVSSTSSVNALRAACNAVWEFEAQQGTDAACSLILPQFEF